MRYGRYPALLVIGVQREADPDEASLFTRLVSRNVINIEFSPWTACVLDEGMSRETGIRRLKEAHTALGVSA
jgi:hypothetical protein